ncbi:MAG: hypothetical protein CMH58_01445 [Myxococcales bacterium]|nr:hypothetical protein [Myxococcales bacterium]|tara:strand:+ start:77 stop:1129 length:1053 start_codon:yes stop_codon:yes gene_type:complete
MTKLRLGLTFVLSSPLWLRLCLLFEDFHGGWSLVAGAVLPGLAFVTASLAWWLRLRLGRRLAIALIAFNLAVTIEDLAVGRTGANQGWPVLTWNLADAAEYPNQLDCAVTILSNQPRGLWAFQEMSRAETKALERRLRLRCIHLEYHDQGSRNGPALCVPVENDWVVQSGYAHEMTGDAVNRYLFAEVIPPNGPVLNVANVHLQSYWGSRTGRESANSGIFSQLQATRRQLQKMTRRQRAQVKRISRRYQGMKDPLLLIGDFNSTANTWIHHHLRQNFQDAHRQRGWGFGGSRPMPFLPQSMSPRLDYLYASNDLLWSGETRTIPASDDCSDHRLVQSWLSLKAATTDRD